MAKWRMALALLAAVAGVGSGGAAEAQERPPVEVMILGSYHMGNPGLDLVNANVDDVTVPRRQAEIRAVVDALARWRPTKVLVEIQAPAPFAVQSYRRFTVAELSTNRNEIWQLGYRLAHQLGHRDVYGFDERPSEGEPNYWQYERVEAYASAHGQRPLVDATTAYFRDHVAAFERIQATRSVAQLLLGENDPDANRADHSRGYYFALPLGDADNQVGAEFNTYWYMRNAKMFAKIALIAEPGDRLLVLVGSGHRYWLTHFAETVPGFRLVDPRPYLAEAAAARH